MIAVVAPDKADAARAHLTEAGHEVHRIGTVTAGEGVTYRGNL
ncbi:MAG: AIR synthase-related protein [Sagittula sp.]